MTILLACVNFRHLAFATRTRLADCELRMSNCSEGRDRFGARIRDISQRSLKASNAERSQLPWEGVEDRLGLTTGDSTDTTCYKGDVSGICLPFVNQRETSTQYSND